MCTRGDGALSSPTVKDDTLARLEDLLSARSVPAELLNNLQAKERASIARQGGRPQDIRQRSRQLHFAREALKGAVACEHIQEESYPDIWFETARILDEVPPQPVREETASLSQMARAVSHATSAVLMACTLQATRLSTPHDMDRFRAAMVQYASTLCEVSGGGPLPPDAISREQLHFLYHMTAAPSVATWISVLMTRLDVTWCGRHPEVVKRTQTFAAELATIIVVRDTAVPPSELARGCICFALVCSGVIPAEQLRPRHLSGENWDMMIACFGGGRGQNGTVCGLPGMMQEAVDLSIQLALRENGEELRDRVSSIVEVLCRATQTPNAAPSLAPALQEANQPQQQSEEVLCRATQTPNAAPSLAPALQEANQPQQQSEEISLPPLSSEQRGDSAEAAELTKISLPPLSSEQRVDSAEAAELTKVGALASKGGDAIERNAAVLVLCGSIELRDEDGFLVAELTEGTCFNDQAVSSCDSDESTQEDGEDTDFLTGSMSSLNIGSDDGGFEADPN